MKTIASLALVKISWDHSRKDHIENFVPFIATLIIKKNYKEIDVNQVCEDFKQEFGLIIPYHPMVTLLNRARRRKIIKRERGAYVPLKDNVLKHDFTDMSKEQERRHEKVINEFIDFSKTKYNVEIDRYDAELMFLSFLKSYDLDILFASQEKSILPEVKQSKRERFLVSNFIKNAYETEPACFNFILDIAIGHILASAILYGAEFKKFEAKLGNLNLYLDTGFILMLLGGEGKEREWVYVDLLKRLSGQGAKLFLFAHTYEEIMGILENCLRWVEKPNFDPSRATPMLKHCVENKFTQSDVQRFITNLDTRLMEYKITKTETPNFIKYKKYQINEESLRSHIIKTYIENNPYFREWEKENVMQKDIRSISAINRLRKGKEPKNIKKAGHMFITTNNSLALANRRFEVSEKGDKFFIPSCLTDVFIGTLVWLQSPAQVVDLNQKKIIADCYAALQPDNRLIKKFVSEVEKLKNEKKILPEESISLRCDIVAREMLAEKTMGDPEYFTEKTTLEILEEFKVKIKKEEEQRYLKEKEKYEKIQEDLMTTEKAKVNLERSIDRIAEKFSNFTGNAIFLLLGILFLTGSILSFFPYFQNSPRLFLLLYLLLLIFAAGNVIFGINIKGLRDKTKRVIRSKITRWIKVKKAGGNER